MLPIAAAMAGIFCAAICSFAGLSVTPDTPVVSGKITVTVKPEGKYSAAFIAVNGITKHVVAAGPGPAREVWEFDTTTVSDGPCIIALETLNADEETHRQSRFLLIGNTRDYGPVLKELRTLCLRKQYAAAHALLWSAPAVSSLVIPADSKRESISEYQAVAAQLSRDVETGAYQFSNYRPYREIVKDLALIEQYPVAVVPCGACHVTAQWALQDGRYKDASVYCERMLNKFQEQLTLPMMEQCRLVFTGLDDYNYSRSMIQRLKWCAERATASRKRLPRADYLVALLERYLGNKARARDLFRKLETQSVDPALGLWLIYQSGVFEKEQKNYDQARAVFSKLLKEQTERIGEYAAFQLGECWSGERDYRKALEYHERVAQTHSAITDRPWAVFQSASGYRELRNHEKAREYFTMFVTDYPEHKLTRRAKYLLAETIYDDARGRQWGMNPQLELEELTKQLKELMENQPTAKESEECSQLLSQAMRDVTDTYNDRGQYDMARRTYARLVGYEAVGLPRPKDEKEGNDLRILQQESPTAMKLFRIADELYCKRAYEQAIRQYRHFLLVAPGHKKAPEAQYYIGISYAGLKNYEKAIEELKKVIENYPESAWTDDALERAGTYLGGNLDDMEGAMAFYRELLEKYPESNNAALAQYLLGSSYYVLKDYKRAKIEYGKVISTYSTSDLVGRAKQRITEITAEEQPKKPRKTA